MIKNVTFRNRIAISAHFAGWWVTDGLPNEDFAAYIEERAKGGIGLFVIGATGPTYDAGPDWMHLLTSRPTRADRCTSCPTSMSRPTSPGQPTALLASARHLPRTIWTATPATMRLSRVSCSKQTQSSTSKHIMGESPVIYVKRKRRLQKG